MTDICKFFATAAKGTEGALKGELRSHRFRGIQATRGGVGFEGPMAEGFRACLELRTAMRVLVQLAEFEAPNEDALYRGVHDQVWEEWLDPEKTFAIRATTTSSAMTHSKFVALKSKDAIVDRLRVKQGARPSVSVEDPDVLISVRVAKDVATVYLDVGGRALHLRGYREEAVDAPLKETLAASMLWLAGWTGSEPLVDPMCGSGTIAIEAALVAHRIAPGLLKPRFGFQRWRSFGPEEKKVFRELVEEAKARVQKKPNAEIEARDIDVRAVAVTRSNAKRAGVDIRVEQANVSDLRTRQPVFVVTNPPYGERLGITASDERGMGRALAGLPETSRIAMLAGAPHLLEAMPMRADKTITLMNGDIECRLALYEARGGRR